MRTKAGAYVWTLSRGKVVSRDAFDRPLRMVGTLIDVTKRKEAERLIEHMALHDGLTGLANRTLLSDRLDQVVANAARDGGTFAVLACDLDGFKAVNDGLGHPAGDAVLRTIAGRLKSVVRDCDTVSRLGGDEFALVLGRMEDAREAATVAGRIIDEVSEPVWVDGRMVTVGVSVGIAVATGLVGGAGLLKSADIALYRAKELGGNRFCVFESGMDSKATLGGKLENDMRAAVRSGGFALEYQPIVDLGARSIRCLEALMRWDHPEHGTIAPAEFIPLAERTGLIVPIGDWALREACREAAEWPDGIQVAVNVSAVQFRQLGALEDSVLGALSSSRLPADRLVLEITESVLVQDAEAVLAALHRLRTLGVNIALDDFGTGYSSLSYLRRFPFDKIKIDRSFVQDIENPNTAAIVRAVVGLGLRVGAAITAEGVETQHQLEKVRKEGCTEVQGFLFSRPLRPAEAAKLIRLMEASAVAA